MGQSLEKSRARLARFAVLALALPLGACASTKQSAGLQRVDQLVTRVEAVHLQAELSKQSVYQTLLTLRPVVMPTEGDAAALFGSFVDALAASEDRARELHAAIAPMEQSARQVFAQWEQDLRAISSDSMRERSRNRMLEARMQYDAVARSAKRASEDYTALNESMQDIALFLGHDFNPTAIALIEADALAVRERAQALGTELERCLAAAKEYAAAAAPLGVAIQPTVQETADPKGADPKRVGQGAGAKPTTSSPQQTPRR